MAKPGPKPGSKHAGMFTANDPRQSPGGRPKKLAEIEAHAQLYTIEAIEVQVEIMRDQEAPAVARLRATELVNERGWGKPRQPVEHSGKVDVGAVAVALFEGLKDIPGANERAAKVLKPLIDEPETVH